MVLYPWVGPELVANEWVVGKLCHVFDLVGSGAPSGPLISRGTSEEECFRAMRPVLLLLLHAFPAKRQGASCKQAAVKGCHNPPLVGLAISKQDPTNRGHGAQYLYRPPPARAGLHPIVSTSHEISSYGKLR